ncbi:MAG: hypothetical protein VYE04_09705 [Pseudomonadota bacterium]|nr:hypothetical protein [Pseudomonadota bacterium]
MDQALSKQRKSTSPKPDDTWESIAARELPELDLTEATSALQSWNLHVFMRPAAPENSPRAGNPILPSDVIFLEAPTRPARGIFGDVRD